MRRSRRLCGVLSNPTGRNEFVFRGALQLEIVIFADRNGNRIFDGEPCFTVVMENLTIPVERSTWGGIKALYTDF